MVLTYSGNQLDDLLGGVREVGDRLRFLGDRREVERALGEHVVGALVDRDHAQLQVDLGAQRIEQRVVFELG